MSPHLSKKEVDFIDIVYKSAFSEEALFSAVIEKIKEYDIKDVSLYIINKKTARTDQYFPKEEEWQIPNTEKLWLLGQLDVNPNCIEPNFTYIKNREETIQCDPQQHQKDKEKYHYHCNDILYCTLPTTDKENKPILVLRNWSLQKELENVKELCQKLQPHINNATTAIDQLIVHQKLEGLLSDKQTLTKRIQKDEENLKRRILELTALHDSSNALSYTLNYTQIESILMDTLEKVLHFDACSILLQDFSSNGELTIRLNKPFNQKEIDKLTENSCTALSPFIKTPIEKEKIKHQIEKNYQSSEKDEFESIKSVANVPLIFKESVIGMISISSIRPNAFSRNEMTFLHTMANQLAANLGRLKIIKELEKSKISSLVQSMNEAVMMLDEHHNMVIYNPVAAKLLELEEKQEHKFERVSKGFQELGILPFYKTVVKTKQELLNKHIQYNDKSYAVNITPVTDTEAGTLGTVIAMHDITELEKAARINEQRLKVIHQVNDVIQSIPNIEKLLSILMEFLLGIIQAKMGSIQIKQDKVFYSKVHANFPDKVRRLYKFKNGSTLSEHVIATKKPCIIKNYSENKTVETEKIRVLIESYIGLPIIVKEEVIGVVNIVRRNEDVITPLSDEDVETLITLTNLSGTAIHNAILYQDQLKKEKIDQELKVATDIQSKLLPSKTPQIPKISFGAISIPARQIGGDYYDFFELKNDKLGIVIADIVGKGIPAGLFMGMLKSMLHTHLKEFESPKEALFKVNNVLYHDPVNNKFVPLIYGILDPKKQTFTYCNAGHEPGLFYSKGEFEWISSECPPLGAFENVEFNETCLKLTHGDQILMYTDGIIESRNNKGINYGDKRLKAFIKKNENLSPKELIQKLYETLIEYSDLEPQHDDLTALGFKYDKNYKGNEEKPIKVIEKTVTSARSNIKIIREIVEKICIDIGFNETEIFDIKLAINEAQANVIEHAYFGSEEGDIVFKFEQYKETLIVTIKDYGQGKNQKTIKNKHSDLKELEGSGLGMFLINNVMDEVVFKPLSSGTELKLVKKLKKS